MMSLQAMSCVSRKGGTEKVGDCAGSDKNMAVSGLSHIMALTGTEKAISNLETSHPLCRASISRDQVSAILGWPRECWLIGGRGMALLS